MPRIISFGNHTDPKDLKENSLRSLWEAFKSLDKFTKLQIISAILISAVGITLSTMKGTDILGTIARGEECKTTATGFDVASVNLARDAAGPGAVVCFPSGTYKGDLTASTQGQTWVFTESSVIEGRLNISSAGTTIKGNGATLRRPLTSNEWGDGYDVSISADDVTLQDLKIRGGGFGIGVFGSDRVKIREVDVADTASASLAVWSNHKGSDDLLVENSRFVVTSSTPSHRSSAVIGRNDNPNGQPPNMRPVFRNVYMDQGAEGWFGVEMFESPGMVIEGGEYRGGEVLISPGRSHGLKVLNAKLYLGGRTHSAVEVALIHDTEIAGNTVEGAGALAWLTNKSERLYVHNNNISANSALVNAEQRSGYEGKDHKAINNCVSNPQKVWLGLKGPGTFIDNNGPTSCQTGSTPITPTPAASTPTASPTPVSQDPPAAGSIPSGYALEKAINVGGSEKVVSGKTFIAEKSSGLTHNGNTFSVTTAPLSPTTDPDTSAMLRDGIWTNTGRLESNTSLSNGNYQIFLYSWEDNSPMSYSLEVEGQKVLSNVSTGNANTWRKIGPFPAKVTDGKLTIVATGGHFLISGLEIYSSSPPTPTPTPAPVGGLPTIVPTPTPTPSPTPAVIPQSSFAANYHWNTTIAGTPNFRTTESYPLSKNFGTGSPGGGLPSDNWSASFVGAFSFNNGEYEFTSTSDDGIRVYLDGKRIIDNWVPHSNTTNKATVPVSSGNHEVKVEYFELGGHAIVSLNWKQVISPTPTPTPIPVQPVFYKGINLNGRSVTIEGSRWFSAEQASKQGFITDAWSWSGSYKFSLNPIADSDTSEMLKSALWKSRQGFSASQSLPNGTYDIYFWTIENYQNNYRSFDVKLEGQTTARAIGTQPLGSWRKFGPYRTTVTDRVLNIETVAIKGDPSIFGMAVYSLDSNLRPAIPEPDGDGLTGLYFSSRDLTGIPALRIDPRIDFNWLLGSPISGMPSNDFSIRWVGYIIPEKTERYTFYTTSDDGARLWVNNTQLVNSWRGQAATENSGSINLVAGQKYPITIEYMELGSVASMNLKWSSPSISKEIVPTKILFSK